MLSGFIGTQTVIATGIAANYNSTNVGSYSGVVVTYTLANGLNGGLATNYSLANGSATGVITAGSFVKMQLLLPGETAAPGTPNGKIGTPIAQNTATPFTVTVNAVDAFWNVVSSAPGNTIAISTTDGTAILPSNANLASGTQSFSITLRTPGSYTITATNSSDGTKTANTSSSVIVTAGTKTSIADGPWSTSSTWSPAGKPYLFDLVRINTNHDITVTANDTCASINFIGTGSTLSVNTGVTLTVTGAVTLDSYNDNRFTDAIIGGAGTLNAGSLNMGLASVLNSTANSENTLVLNIPAMNVAGDFTIYNNDEGGGDANEPRFFINPPCVLSVNKIAMIQTGNGGGGSRIITFDIDNGGTLNLAGGVNPITISSEIGLDFDHVNFALGSTSTINYNGTVAQNILTSISNSRVGGTTNSNIPVNYGNLTISNTTGTTTTVATGRTINVAGNWTNNGVFNATSSTVNFNGTGAQAIAGNTVTTFDDVTIGKTGGTLSVNTNATVGDDLTFTTTGGTLSVSSPRVLTVTDDLFINSNANNAVNVSITGTGTLNASDTVNVGVDPNPNQNSTVLTTLNSSLAIFNIGTDLNINSYYGNGSRRNNGVFNLASGTLTINGEIDTNNEDGGNLSTFSMITGSQSGLLKLAGGVPFNLSSTGTNTVNLNGTSAVVEYLGSVPQTALGTTYRTLKINNSNTGVTLSGNTTATTLDLTDGLLTTGTNTMTVASGGSIINASVSSYVNGKLNRTFTNTTPATFPVGKGGVYSPVVFNYAAAPGTRTVTIEQFETGTPFTSSASLATFGSRYWNVTQSATGVGYRVGLNDSGNTAPSGSSVVILRRDNVTITANDTNYSAPNYTNATAFAAATLSNDVSLGVINIPLSITGITAINTKIYNGNAIATAIGTPTLSGSISSGDVVTLSGTAVYTFDTKHIGTGKAVTVSGLTLSGANASGYTLPTNQIPGLMGDITVRPIVVTANTNTKTFDNFATSAALPTITSGVLQGTDTFGFIQTYDNKNAGTNKTLTPSGNVNDGNSGNNYAVTFVENNTGVINAKTLTIASPTTINKVYDGTNVAATTSGSWALTGVISPNDVTLNKSAVFASKDFGTWAITSTSSISGVDAGNYLLIQPTLSSRTISKAVLTITGTTTEDKDYDRTNTAVLSDGILNGVISGEDVTLLLSGRYASANAGGPYVITSTSTIVGADIANYTLTQPTLTPRSINKVTLTVIGANSADKAYNGNTNAIVTGGILVGVISGDGVSLTQSGIFPTKDAGGPYSITPNFSISGSPAANYILTQPVLADASITPKSLTISGISQNKVYDGTSEAILLSGGSLVGVVAGESVMLDLIVNFYSSPGVTVKDAGGPYLVTSTSTIASGNIATDLANYTLIQPTLTSRSITKLPLTITGTTTVDKEYDRTNAALLTDGVLNGVLLGEDVSLVLSGRYASANAGGPYIMTSTSTLIGSDIANYTLVQPSTLTPRSISKVTLTIDGATTIDKDYNGNTNAVVIGGSLVGIVPGDLISLTQAGFYPTKNVGGPYAITPNFSIGGAAAINYNLIQSPLADASINPKTLTIIGTTQNKMYDGTDTATLIGEGLSGLVSGEDVVLNFVANYSSKDAGGPYTITSNSSISGSDIGNYTFIQPSVLTPARSITRIPLTVTGVTASNRVYDGNRIATINTAAAVLNGTILLGETVTLNTTGATAIFDTRDVGVGKTVTCANFNLDGIDANNYTVIQPTMTAEITARTLTITANNISKCAESTYNFTGTEFTRDYIVPGDVTSVTLTSVGSDTSAIVGNYPIVASNAIGNGIDNYDILYIPGNLVVNTLPTATMFVPDSSCLNEQTRVTFTGFNGTGIQQYKFYYTIDGVQQTITSLPGNSIATINVPTNSVRTVVYALTKVEDLNTGCSTDITLPVLTVIIGQCTTIRDNFCGKTFRFLNEIVQCNPVSGATQYRFEVTDETNVRVVTSGNHTFNPAAFTFDHPTNRGFNWAKDYSFRVALFIGGNWLAYGPSCTARTPNEPAALPTKLRSPWFCNQTVGSMNTFIQCDPVHLATNYEFRLTGPGGYNQARTSTSIAINLTTFPNLRYNTQYTVSVRAFSGGIWIEPIETCTITTPSVPQTSLVAQHCNINTTTKFVVMARTVFYAEAYKFRISDGTTIAEIESPNIYFAASTVTGGMIVTGKVYTVQVDVKYNGVFLENWGPTCQLTIPSFRMSDTNTSSIFNVKAFPNPFATHFNLDIESSSDAQVEMKVYDMIGRQLEVRKATVSELSVLEVGRNYPAGVYNIIVSQGEKVKSLRMVKR
ncbi:YDG domain-containing protein [Flavobacterium myungsuense]|uniref:YDG domain-containing protein n=1 Tax=Flavobacterium myungsuense TaxID=651823 RepID=UPI00363FA5BC